MEKELINAMELDADKLWLTLLPYVKTHVRELLQLALNDALAICHQKAVSGSITTKMEMKALHEMLTILIETLKI